MCLEWNFPFCSIHDNIQFFWSMGFVFFYCSTCIHYKNEEKRMLVYEEFLFFVLSQIVSVIQTVFMPLEGRETHWHQLAGELVGPAVVDSEWYQSLERGRWLILIQGRIKECECSSTNRDAAGQGHWLRDLVISGLMWSTMESGNKSTMSLCDLQLEVYKLGAMWTEWWCFDTLKHTQGSPYLASLYSFLLKTRAGQQSTSPNRFSSHFLKFLVLHYIECYH